MTATSRKEHGTGAPPKRWPSPTRHELRALDAIEKQGTWELDGRDIKGTNRDKVLFPARPGARSVTKRDFIRYHACIAPHMLPYLADRAVNPHRYPDGATRPGFWHKARPDHAPDYVQE